MASAPLKWLLTIGGTALKTTAKVLTDAVNELHDAVGTLNTRASSLESTKADVTTVNNSLNTKVNKTDALTLEEIDASTNLINKVAAAEAVKEVNDSLGGLKFGKNGDGNFGYYGADGSLIPFKSGCEIVATGVSSQTLSLENGTYYGISFRDCYGGTASVGFSNISKTIATGGINRSPSTSSFIFAKLEVTNGTLTVTNTWSSTGWNDSYYSSLWIVLK